MRTKGYISTKFIQVEIRYYHRLWYMSTSSSQWKSTFECLTKIGVWQTKRGRVGGKDIVKIRQHRNTQSIDESKYGANDNFFAIGQFSDKFTEKKTRHKSQLIRSSVIKMILNAYWMQLVVL